MPSQIGIRLNSLDDLLAGQPLGKRDLVVDRPALDQGVEHLAHAGILAELVLARLQRALAPQIGEIDDARHEQAAIGDHLVVLEALGDAAHSLPFRNHHHGGGGERARAIELDPEKIEEREKRTRSEQARA